MSQKPETVLINNADCIATMDPENNVLERSSIVVVGGRIDHIGVVEAGKDTYDKVIDATGSLVLPGFINGHHHMFQGMMRGYANIQNQPIGPWIEKVSQVARAMDEEMVMHAAMLNMLELIKYGCTTTTDMGYIHPEGRGDFFEATIRAAEVTGIRFHPYFGSMSLSKKDGAAFPDDVVLDKATIFEQTIAAIEKHHNPDPFAMKRVGIAACTIFSNTTFDFRMARDLSSVYGVNLQTHLSESRYESDYADDRYGMRPLEFLRSMGWSGERVSFAHGIYLNDPELGHIARDGSTIVHCPISNARGALGEIGTAPVREMLKCGINVALGVDGSAGNDSSNLREEIRIARIMQGTRSEATYLQPEQVLRMATTAGSTLLQWPEIGSLEVGKAADLSMFPLQTLEQAGSWDPITAFTSTQATPAEMVMINGRTVVEHGRFTNLDVSALLHTIKQSMRILRDRM